MIMKFIFGKQKNERPNTEEETEMRNTFASKLKELRRERGMGQEQLASVCGVSVQAVSKWECGQSYPDIELLATIADKFGVTIDSLLREDKEVEAAEVKPTEEVKPAEENTEKSPDDRLLDAIAEKFDVKREDIGSVDVHMSTGDGNVTKTFGEAGGIPDDGVLRVVQFMGSRMIDIREIGAYRRRSEKIPLSLSGVNGQSEIRVEIWGNADVGITDNRDVSVSVTAGGAVNVDGAVSGPVTAGGEVNCGTVNGPVNAGGGINCDTVNGPVSAGGDVNCDTVNGWIRAEGDVNCDDVSGGVSAAGDINCSDVQSGNVEAAGDVDCGEVQCGSVSAGGDVNCGDVTGKVEAGGDVGCGDVAGSVTAGGDVDCGDVGSNVSAGGDVDCSDVGGNVSADGGISSDGSIRIVTDRGRKNERSSASGGFDIPDLSGLGEFISRTVNEAMEGAFGKQKKQEREDNDDPTDDDMPQDN